MTWAFLTLVSGETRLINLDQFMFALNEGDSCYLVAHNHANSLQVKETEAEIAKIVGCKNSRSSSNRHHQQRQQHQYTW